MHCRDDVRFPITVFRCAVWFLAGSGPALAVCNPPINYAEHGATQECCDVPAQVRYRANSDLHIALGNWSRLSVGPDQLGHLRVARDHPAIQGVSQASSRP